MEGRKMSRSKNIKRLVVVPILGTALALTQLSGSAFAAGAKFDLAGFAKAFNAAGYDQVADGINRADNPPLTLADGSTFRLSKKIADKIKAGKAFNYVESIQSNGIALFSPQYMIGYKASCNIAKKFGPINCKEVAPNPAGPTQQVAQIQALLNTGQIDCLSIEPTDSNSLTDITNAAMKKGIPVFTVGVSTNGNEFTNWTQIPDLEGLYAAKTLLAWMKKTGTDLTVFSATGGDTTQYWAQHRMMGFEKGIKAAIPTATFINSATSNQLNVSYDPATTYDAYKALLAGQPKLQFILSVDIGAEHATRAIHDAGLDGKVFSMGWNVSKGQLDGIEAGTQVAALDQGWAQQSAFGAAACMAYLHTGRVAPNTQHLIPVSKSNLDAARVAFNKLTGANN